MKSPYLPPRRKNHISNYVKYIATREGVERADDTKKNLPETKKQQDSLAELLKKYPDSKELHEYEDYKHRPTRGNADELILRIAEAHPELLGGRDGYVAYIANRPGAEKLSSHGLFTDEGVPIVLDETAREIADCESNVWTHIISLRREDAERLGYDTAASWAKLLRANRNMIAEAMKISPENFRWYAAFHNAVHHPHVHMIAYSVDPKEAYLTPKGIEKIKSELAGQIFRQDLISVYSRETAHRNDLRRMGRETVADIVGRIISGSTVDDEAVDLLLRLAERLSRTKGKKVYGYLKADDKVLVDKIIDILAKNEDIARLYDLWYEQREEVIRTYTDSMPKRIPLSANKDFKSIKNAVIDEAMKLNADIGADDDGGISETGARKSHKSKDGERTHNRASDAESADPDADKKGVGGSYGGDYVRTIRTDRADHKRDLAALGVINLMRYVGRIFDNDIRDGDRRHRMDKKEYQKIAEKKRAHGQKMG